MYNTRSYKTIVTPNLYVNTSRYENNRGGCLWRGVIYVWLHVTDIYIYIYNTSSYATIYYNTFYTSNYV